MPIKNIERALENLFNEIDKDKNGTIDRYEFEGLLEHVGLKFSGRDINILFSQIDVNNDGKIDIKEFIRGVLLMDNI